MLEVRGIHLGKGTPKVCIPMVGTTPEELEVEAFNILQCGCDIVEWRIDHFKEVENIDKLKTMAQRLRELYKEIPLLVTFRSHREGGVYKLSDEKYCKLYESIIPTKLLDIIDIELFMPEEIVEKLILLSRENGVKVILCNHDFDKTPSKEEIIKRLKMMEEKGADIGKIATMPHNVTDLLTLLEATKEAKEQMNCPIITMSMGKIGMLSRITGEIFGSAMTFGVARNASAPGQIPAKELKEVLNFVTKNYNE